MFTFEVELQKTFINLRAGLGINLTAAFSWVCFFAAYKSRSSRPAISLMLWLWSRGTFLVSLDFPLLYLFISAITVYFFTLLYLPSRVYEDNRTTVHVHDHSWLRGRLLHDSSAGYLRLVQTLLTLASYQVPFQVKLYSLLSTSAGSVSSWAWLSPRPSWHSTFHHGQLYFDPRVPRQDK